MGARNHYVFEQDGREYGLEIYREGEWAENPRENDDYYVGEFASFKPCTLRGEAIFGDQYDLFSWLREHDDYAVAAVRYNNYDVTLEFIGEVDEERMYDYDLFIYATDEEPLYSGHDAELRKLDEEVKLEEIYYRGMTIGAAVYSLEEGLSFEEADLLDEWSRDWALHEEDRCVHFCPRLETYDRYDTNIPREDAEEILWTMGWRPDSLKELQ